MRITKISNRVLSVCAFSFLFAYLLSFLFEGRVLYSLLDKAGTDITLYILSAMLTHFLGLFTCGFFCKSRKTAKTIIMLCMGLCVLFTLPFFFDISALRLISLFPCGYASGCAVAAWGYYLEAFTPKSERIKTCADMLIYSNIIMIAINIVTVNFSVTAGLVMSVLCLPVGMFFVSLLPVYSENNRQTPEKPTSASKLRRPLGVLFVFVTIITIDSGLMYQVINPGFEHLTTLTSRYWAVPYIIALAVMRNLHDKSKRPVFLYVGMAMIMCAFLGFMLLGRGAADYLIVDTLMLGACGIFDLFWWSILGETLDIAKNPASVFGIGLSANVFGILCGDLIGFGATFTKLPEAQIAVIALCVVCVTLIILPPLNRQISMLLRNHAFLSAYSALPAVTQEKVASYVKPLDPLTERENEILKLVLDGKSNREIAVAGFITENTVKTHLKSIYSKYSVNSRAELISLVLRGQKD